ncbi:MAG TPA: LacI family DNA-binding transcriptional regulator [Casimicrobiaceae bacterium]|nr:LacI family DNA-binding transcriptional regulator [Casimicrobiaceae bacterium]
MTQSSPPRKAVAGHKRAPAGASKAGAGAVDSRPRLVDVAHAAGVSTMTVVRVLREPDKVAQRTRERVLEVVRRTGYTPNLVARGLVSNRTSLVAAVIPVLTNSLIAEIMQGLSDALASADYHLLIGASGFSAAEEETLVRAFLSRRVDAIYLTGIVHTDATVRMLKAAGIPVVEGGNLTRRPIDMLVGYSNVDAARDVTSYLIRAGYPTIGYIGAYPKDNDRARDRRRGYELAFARAKRRIDPSLCVETTLDIDAGAQAMATMLEHRPDVRAVFCSADAIAIGALYECQRRGLAIPGDIAIAGFDDTPIAAQVVPALTTLRVPRYAIGLRAGEMIRDRLAGKPVRRRVVDTGYEFVPRTSA